MSPISEDFSETISESFDFCDLKADIMVTLYANGCFEVKDIDLLVETDSLEVITPSERWFFQLYDQVYPDRCHIQTRKNSAETQTSIEIQLVKQQPRNTWPQINTYSSTPEVPTRNVSGVGPSVPFNTKLDIDMADTQIVDMLLKNLKTDVYETSEKLTLCLYVKDVSQLDVTFTETNFTLIFRTRDENFLKNHSIDSDRSMKLFVRTKGRIIPQKSKFNKTKNMIEIVLMKENSTTQNWTRVDAIEYSENQRSNLLNLAAIPSSPTGSPSAAIPLPPPCPQIHSRKSDKTISSTAFTMGIEKNQAKSLMNHSSGSVGFTGIYNPANSCFMNAAVQCLSNTRELRDYFLNEFYKQEINKTNPLGMKGIMAEEFGILMKNLWTGKHDWVYGDKLRDYVAKRHQEFVGNGQHDAQELLTILLDAIHEDLNRVIEKPLVPPVEDNGRPDEIVAAEYWRGYLSRNDSIIVQLFTGQFKSKTKCPMCHRESVAFDPFTSVSVPVPKRVSIETIVTLRAVEKPPVKYRVVMSSEGGVTEFKRILSSMCGLPVNKMVAFKVRSSRNIDILKEDDRLSGGSYSLSSDMVYVTEVLTPAECNNEPIHRLTFIQRIFRLTDFASKCAYCEASPNPHVPPTPCNKCFQVFYCDEACMKFHSSDHKTYCGFRASDMFDSIGNPFIISLPESKLNFHDVLQEIQIAIKRSVDVEIRKSTNYRSNYTYNHDDDYNSDDDETFSDIESVDWTTMKATLASSDSWSICRLGDYFVKNRQTKRRRNGSQQGNRKEKLMKNGAISDDSMSDEESESFESFEQERPLFRLMPLNKNSSNSVLPAIVEAGEETDKILRRFSEFSIDWFTDNKREAPLKVNPSKNFYGFNGLIEHESVRESSTSELDLTLQQCLQMFIEPEILSPDDKWFCPKCKEHVQAEKKMSIWRLPPILIVHLKRFKYYHGTSFGYFSDSRMKIDTHVKYPTHNLDMSTFCSSNIDPSQSRYDLFGVINHRGSAWFGHYTSLARLLSFNDPAKTEIGWRNFDDEHVSSLPADKDIVRSDAYVLFYRQRNSTVDLFPCDSNSSVQSPVSMDISDDSPSYSNRWPIGASVRDADHMDDINDLMK